MRPTALTWVASVSTRPGPDTAYEPRCAISQSSPVPSTAEYWHIGETTTRLRRVRFLIWSGENSLDMGRLKQGLECCRAY